MAAGRHPALSIPTGTEPPAASSSEPVVLQKHSSPALGTYEPQHAMLLGTARHKQQGLNPGVWRQS